VKPAISITSKVFCFVFHCTPVQEYTFLFDVFRQLLPVPICELIVTFVSVIPATSMHFWYKISYQYGQLQSKHWRLLTELRALQRSHAGTRIMFEFSWHVSFDWWQS